MKVHFIFHHPKSGVREKSRPQRPAGRPGFALIVSLMLMVLLAVVSVGLLTLASVELRTSGVSKPQAVARANAMLALQLALGDLQKAAGPDRRVTASAEILPGTDPAKARWIGAWDTTQASGSPVWLVSGATASSNAGAPPDAAAIAAGNAARLVGEGSAGSPLVTGSEIVIPLHKIRGAKGVNGNLGWWIGDEGIKARINLADPYHNVAAPSLAEAIRRSHAPGSLGINKMKGFSNVAVSASLNGGLQKAVTDANLTLVDPSAMSAGAVRGLFHDVSVFSEGVLSNSREGGLKRDLNRALYDATPPVTGRIFTDPLGNGPHWDIVRSWASLKVDPAGSPAAPVVQPHRENNSAFGSVAQHGVGPLISRWAIEWWIRMELKSGTRGAAGSRYSIGVGFRPVLQLTNPYNVKLPERVYRLSHNFGQDGGGAGFSGLRWQVGAAKNIRLPWNRLLDLSSSSPLLNGLGDSSGARPWFHYVTPSVALEPGESVVFMPASADWATNLSASNVMPLARGENSTGGVLRFPLSNPPNTVTWEELNTGTAPGFRFGEDRGDDWAAMNGRNYVLSLAVHDGATPATLVNNLGEPLARIERIGNGKFESSNVSLADIRNWAATGDTAGRRVHTVDSFLGNDLVPYYAAASQTRPWARDFNPRFPYPASPNGVPRVNNAEESNPNRSTRLWGLRYGHAGWHTRVDPTEYPIGSGLVYWGTQSTPPLGQVRIVLFDLPFGELLSPGQLQHVNLTARDRPLRNNNRVEPSILGKAGEAGVIQPSYLIGDSFRDPSVGLSDVTYDWSILANREIWDKWFASGIPSNAAATSSAAGISLNPRMRLIKQSENSDALALVRNIDKAAAHLLVQGMFNVNSTSVEAWKAFLSSTANGGSVVAEPGRGLQLDPPTGNDRETRFGRTVVSNSAAGGASGVGDSRWSSAIKLTDAQIDDVARGIVQRIKDRAKLEQRPFYDLAEFINRPATKESGLLQETFDQDSLPPGTPGGTSLTGGRLNQNFLTDFNQNGIEPQGAPGALRQGDFLQAAGAFINVRSDTFRIRTYGEARNATTGLVEGRAWCEAIVQRTPAYVDATQAAETPTATSGNVNQTFGRRFVITSFRWLSPSEI